MERRRQTRSELAKTASKYRNMGNLDPIKRLHYRAIARLIIRTGKRITFKIIPRKAKETETHRQVLMCQS